MKVLRRDLVFGIILLVTAVISFAYAGFVICTESKETVDQVETTSITETTETTETTGVAEITAIEAVETTEWTEPIETTEVIETTDAYTPFFQLSEYERSVVESIVMGEAGGEPYQGQLLVAFCILNGCIKEGVQPSTLRYRYQYSGWNNNPSEDVKNAVSEIFDFGYRPVDDFPLYFYAPKLCNSNWHESQRYICTVGGHKFFGEWSE